MIDLALLGEVELEVRGKLIIRLLIALESLALLPFRGGSALAKLEFNFSASLVTLASSTEILGSDFIDFFSISFSAHLIGNSTGSTFTVPHPTEFMFVMVLGTLVCGIESALVIEPKCLLLESKPLKGLPRLRKSESSDWLDCILDICSETPKICFPLSLQAPSILKELKLDATFVSSDLDLKGSLADWTNETFFSAGLDPEGSSILWTDETFVSAGLDPEVALDPEGSSKDCAAETSASVTLDPKDLLALPAVSIGLKDDLWVEPDSPFFKLLSS
nr:hypothetical protein Iba_chr11aCG16030 [Ipomoea batatas]